MRSTEPWCFRSCSWCLWKARQGGVHWTCGVKVLEYWMTSSLKIKLNHSWNFWRNWNVPLVLLERSRWAGFNGIYLVRFGLRMWEILIFKQFLLLKIPKNQVLEGKTSWQLGNIWRLTIQFKHDFRSYLAVQKIKFKHDFCSYLAVQKIDTHIAKLCSHVEFPYFVMGSHLGHWHRPH
jgi:hypothetical protein